MPVQLRRVNHDSSWLLSFPTPPEYPASTFNVLIDPWLDDSAQIDYHPSFSEQKRTKSALVKSISELETLLHAEVGKDGPSVKPRSDIVDAILLSHPFTDHMHPPTLLSIGQHTFLVTKESGSALQSLLGGRKKVAESGKRIVQLEQACYRQQPSGLTSSREFHQTVVSCTPNENPPLPSNVRIMQVAPQERFSLLNGPAGIAWSKLHGAILFLWSSNDSEQRAADEGSGSEYPFWHALLYSPHGITSLSIPTWLQDPTFQCEAIVTPLDKIVLPAWLSGIVNLGLPAAIQCIIDDTFPAKHIIATHEERKEAKGLVASLIRRYWLGKETPDASNEGLRQLRQRDEDRQVEAQGVVDLLLSLGRSSGQATTKIHVLDINETLTL